MICCHNNQGLIEKMLPFQVNVAISLETGQHIQFAEGIGGTP